MFAGFIFQKYPFFSGKDNFDQLLKYAEVLGTDDLHAFLGKYNATISHYEEKLGEYPKVSFTKFITPTNKHLVNEQALDLLSKMMIYDLNERITPKEAMEHPYFDPVKEHNAKINLITDL